MKKTLLLFAIVSTTMQILSCSKKSSEDKNDKGLLSIANLNVLVTTLPKEQFISLTFVNESTGVAVSNHGKIIKTTDAGKTWQTMESLGDDMLLDKVQFTDAQNGYVIAGDSDGGYLYKTVDGGNTWTKRNFDPAQAGIPNDMFFINKNVGFITGPNLFIKTTDGGNSWSDVMENSSYNFNNVNFKSATDGYVTCNNGTYFKTTSAGNNWQKETLPSNLILKDIYFAGSKLYFNSSVGLLDVANPSQTITLPAGAYNLLFLDEMRCIGVGEHYENAYWPYGDVLVTNDLWKTNEKKTFQPSQAYTFKCIAKMNANKAMAIGYGSEAIAATISW